MQPLDDNEAFKIRANAGDGPDCDVNPVDPVPLLTPEPPEVPCDDPVETGVEEFFKPAPAPAAARRLRLPAPLTLFSPDQLVSCPPGTVPDEDVEQVDVFFGALTRSIDFAEITVGGEPLFDQTTLYNLASVAGTIQSTVYDFLGETAPAQEPARAVYIAGGLPAKILELVAITKLPVSIITELWNHILNQQAALDTAATALAQRQLVCGYYNVNLWVVCYDRDDAGYRVVYVEPNDPLAVLVPAGSVFSDLSQADANKLAIQSAVGVLPCQFGNLEQVISCDSEYGGDYSDDVTFSWPTLDDPSTTKISDIGGVVELDGNGIRVNAPVAEHLFLTYDEVASSGSAAAQRELVLQVTVPAGAVSATTQAEANSKARALALSYLDCFIPARKRVLECTDPDVSQPAFEQSQLPGMTKEKVLSEIVTGYTNLEHLLPTLKPDNTTFLAGPEIDERTSVRLIIPEGAFVGDSHQSADLAAESYALSAAATKLDCNWRSRQLTYACDDAEDYDSFIFHLDDPLYVPDGAVGLTYAGPFEVDSKRGQFVVVSILERDASEGVEATSGLVELMASVERSEPYSYTTARGDFDSPTSQAAADTIAAAHASSQLSCIYCNPEIPANCPPDGPLTLPINIGSYPGYSFDSTRGAPGLGYHWDSSVTPSRWRIDTVLCEHSASGEVPQTDPNSWFCAFDAQEAARVAEESGTQPLRTKDTAQSCRYCNDYFTAACCQSAEPGAEIVMITKFEGQDCVDLATAFDGFSEEGGCQGSSISDPYDIVAIPACSMFGNDKDAANLQAQNIAFAQLNCLFSNDEAVADCPDLCAGVTPGTTFEVEVGDKTYEGTHGECVFVGVESASIEAGLFRSQCSKAQAQAQADAMALAQLVCLWTNNDQTASCGEIAEGDITHEAAVWDVTIPEGTIITDKGTPYANVLALKMGIAQLFCAYTNEEQCGGCVTVGHVPRESIAADNNGGLHLNICFTEVMDAASAAMEECIAEGTILTMVSTDHANDLAEALIPKIPCIWLNNLVTAACENRGRPHPSGFFNSSVNPRENESPTLCEATDVSFRIAVATLVCLWTNDDQTYGTCPEGFSLVEAGFVGADTIIAPDSGVANDIAFSMARSMVICEQDFFGNAMQTHSDCGTDGEEPDENRWELLVSGICRVDEIMSTDQETADAIALGVAKARTKCAPKERSNASAYGADNCSPLTQCKQGEVGGETLTSYGWTQSEIDALAQAMADANSICCPEVTYNSEQIAETPECEECANECLPRGTVAAGSIPSWNSNTTTAKEEADAIALAIAEAMTFCCPDPCFNAEEKTGTDSCTTPNTQCVQGSVAAGTIPSWTSQADADSIAQNIADATSVCCPPDPTYNGVTGSVNFVDCDGATVLTLVWTDGVITSPEGDQPDVDLGSCDATSSA